MEPSAANATAPTLVQCGMQRVAVVVALTGIIVAAISGQSAVETRVDAALAKVRHEVPGVAVTIAVDGQIVYAKGLGATAAGGGSRVTAETQFRLASVSKPITATAIFRLVQQGKIDIDRPAKDYCPALATLNQAPTVRHFLLHQSGMRHTSDAEDETITGAPANFAASLARITSERLRFPPGQKTLYTSWGYTALGCVIESVSRVSYVEFVREHVLRPARMSQTTFDHPTYAAPNFSPGYRRQGNGFEPSLVVDTRFKTPASGIISTTNDLVSFGLALLNNQLIPGELLQQMLAHRKPADGEEPLYSAGWIIGPATLGVPAFNYTGSMEGTTAFLGLVPERRIVVALLTNRERFVPGVTPVIGEALRGALGLPPR